MTYKHYPFILFFFVFSMPYFGDQEQCLGMKCPDNLHKQVTFGVVVQSSTLNPLVGSKPSPIKHLTVTNPENFWTYQWFSDIHPPPPPSPFPHHHHHQHHHPFPIWAFGSKQKIQHLMHFQKNICVPWRYFWVEVFVDYFIQLFHKIYMEKILKECFWALFWVTVVLKRY